MILHFFALVGEVLVFGSIAFVLLILMYGFVENAIKKRKDRARDRKENPRELFNNNYGQLLAGRHLRTVMEEARKIGCNGEILAVIGQAQFELTHGAYTKTQALERIDAIRVLLMYYGVESVFIGNMLMHASDAIVKLDMTVAEYFRRKDAGEEMPE